MPPALAPRLRLLASVVSVALLAVIAAAVWGYLQLRGSLPQLDGTSRVAGLGSEVTVLRDALGVPTVRGASRADDARALGFLHAQDRFFQMDLLRRRAAGELAELFGTGALPIDRNTRPDHFRELSAQVVASLPAAQRQLLEGYAAGVNAGLAALRNPPFEYTVLRSTPRPWQSEDSILIVYAMTLDLQDSANLYERSLATLRDRFGMEAVNFFAPLLTPDDAALDGSTAPLPPIPGPEIMALRPRGPASPGRLPLNHASFFPRPWQQVNDGSFFAGSNSFALAGAHTANGAGLLGNDPHLNLGVPNIWYRVSLEWPDQDGPHRVVGVTLPGLPIMVIGSNGRVAWGLTDAYADTNDLVAVEVNAVAPSLYKLPGHDDLVAIETHRDVIQIKGGTTETVESRWTAWGPIIGADFRGRPLAHHRVAFDPAATNLEFQRLETARTSREAIEIAHVSGIPAHNLIVADDTGSIAWTIAGKIPQRTGFDGRLPVSWSFGDRRWTGYVAPAEIPTVANPPNGRLWTANNRLLGGPALATLGDGGYASPPRAAQIRDRLASLEQASPPDFLELQRDDRAVFLERWQQLILATLTSDVLAEKPARADFRRLVERWEGRASVSSVSYRLVRNFRNAVADLTLGPIFAGCSALSPEFTWTRFNYEPALWKIIQEKPLHLLSPAYASWNELLLAAIDRVEVDLTAEGVRLELATWGSRNRADLRHPFSRFLPGVLTRWLDLPADPLPGDANMPLIQGPSFGASMRLAVSPGHEEEGLFAMPGGESGHPLSPFYRAGHAAWVHGLPSRLLPGQTQHVLKLLP
jgi:penicillin amidase